MTTQHQISTNAITLSGEVGSGKSALAQALLERLPGWERINTGQRFRDFCSSKGMSIEQVSELDDKVHREFDQTQRELLQNRSAVIVEGRLAGWLARDLENVFRVYCSAPIDVRIDRYIQREQVTRIQAETNICQRDEKDVEKFRQIYQVEDYRLPHFYHLVLDTSTASPEQLAEIVLEKSGLSHV